MPDLEYSMTTDGGPGSGRYPKGSHMEASEEGGNQHTIAMRAAGALEKAKQLDTGDRSVWTEKAHGASGVASMYSAKAEAAKGASRQAKWHMQAAEMHGMASAEHTKAAQNAFRPGQELLRNGHLGLAILHDELQGEHIKRARSMTTHDETSQALSMTQEQ
jgi:hypothetical protein